MLIGILQTGHAPDDLRAQSGDYPEMFQNLLAGHGFSFRTWDVEHMEFPASATQADGWLITGSRHGVYEEHPFIAPLEDFIREARTAGRPVAGICFGHQIIAQALGGKVEKYAGGWAVGPQQYDFDGEIITMNAWHQDQVTRLPDGAEVIAGNDFCRYAGMVHGDTVLTVQAHPEFSDAFVQGLMDTRGKGVVPDDLMDDARARLGQTNDAAAIGDRIAAFFKSARTKTELPPEG